MAAGPPRPRPSSMSAPGGRGALRRPSLAGSACAPHVLVPTEGHLAPAPLDLAAHERRRRGLGGGHPRARPIPGGYFHGGVSHGVRERPAPLLTTGTSRLIAFEGWYPEPLVQRGERGRRRWGEEAVAVPVRDLTEPMDPLPAGGIPEGRLEGIDAQPSAPATTRSTSGTSAATAPNAVTRPGQVLARFDGPEGEDVALGLASERRAPGRRQGPGERHLRSSPRGRDRRGTQRTSSATCSDTAWTQAPS